MHSSSQFLTIPRQSLELSIIVLILLVYSSFGSPTPSGVSWSEIIQAVSLSLLVLIGVLRTSNREKWTTFAFFFWITLVVGTVMSVENDLRQAARDIIAHLFFGIGILWSRKLSDEAIRTVLFWMTFAGALISLRFLLETNFSFSALAYSSEFTFDGFLKLNTDPLVTFAAGYGIITAFDTKRSHSARIILFGLSCVGLMAIGLSSLRGPMLIVVLSTLLCLLQIKIYRSLVGIISLCLTIACAVYFYEFLEIFAGNFLNKMNTAGTSAKLNEFVYVMSTAGSNWVKLLFGSGFGAQIDVGGRTLPFTHNAISYYFSKTGMIGAVLITASIIGLTYRALFTKLLFDPETALLVLIVMYGLLVNPHYKYMTFGFLLALLIRKLGSKRPEAKNYQIQSHEASRALKEEGVA